MDALEFASSTKNDMEKHHISYSTVNTDSLSTCLAVLLHGTIKEKPFCFIFHTSKSDEAEDEDEDLNDLLLYLLEKLAENLKKDLEIQSLVSEEYSINNLRLLIAGGVIEKHKLTRQAYNLLNTNIDIDLIQDYTNKRDVIYLFQQLRNNVILIKPVTYLDSDENEARGE
jgi:hypothetical protein